MSVYGRVHRPVSGQIQSTSGRIETVRGQIGSISGHVLPPSPEPHRLAPPNAEGEHEFPFLAAVVVVHRRNDVRLHDVFGGGDVIGVVDDIIRIVSSVRIAPHGSVNPGNASGTCPEENEDDVVQDLEDGDEATAHRKPEDTAHVGDEPNDRNFLWKK